MTAAARKKPIKQETLDKNQLDFQKLQDHFLAMTLMQPKVRNLLKNMEPEFFSKGPPKTLLEFLKKNPDFRGERSKDFIETLATKPQVKEELQAIGNYVKIIVLQFEELYQDLSIQDLTEQAANLKHRLIERYVKTENTKLAEQMLAANEKELQKLMQRVDKLNKLLN